MKFLLAAALGAAAACTGAMSGTGGDGDPGGEGGDDSGGSSGSGGRGGGQAGMAGAGGGDETATVAVSPLVRLTAAELVNTVRDAFPELGDGVVQQADLPSDKPLYGFAVGNAEALKVDDVARYAVVASSTGAALASKATDVLAPCNRASAGNAACVKQMLTTRLPRLWRRAVTSADVDGLVTRVFVPLEKEHGFDIAFEAVISRAILSPELLFKVERGVPASDKGAGVVKLDGRALAARLAYLVWRSIPDARLTELADKGELAKPAVLEAELGRMLDDARGAARMREFGREWLHVDETRFPSKSGYEPFNDVLKQQMFEEADRMLDHVLRKGEGKFEDLFAGSYTFATKELAAIYGVSGGGTSFARVELGGAKDRAGILTSALYLTQHAHFDDDRKAIHRGLFVRANMLCNPIAPPPPDIDVNSEPNRIKPGNSCSTCHLQFETIGRGFERFDGIGRYRDTVDGKAIEATGVVRMLDGADRTFGTARELGDMLAGSGQVRSCMARQWLRQALGREEDEEAEGPVLEAAAETLASTHNVRTMVERLITSDAFLYRRNEPVASCQ